MTCPCGRSAKLRRGMCGTCYMRWLRQQPTSLRIRKSADQRFAEKVQRGSDCWEWMGTRGPTGYGQFTPRYRRHVYAHRWAWESVNGAIPDGLTIDHLCRNRGCVNPSHMEVVTRGENTRRGNAIRRANRVRTPATPRRPSNANKTHCVNGHEFTVENTYVYRNTRGCRSCNRIRVSQRKARLRTERAS